MPAVYESLARQKIQPRAAYLVLSEEDFPRREVPPGIRKLEDRGVSVVWSQENPFAVKKLVEVWGKNPGCSIVTFDDDFIYAPDLLPVIREQAQKRDRSVLGFVGKQLFRKGRELSMMYRERRPADEQSDPKRVYLQGGLGTWYQPGSLDERFINRQAFSKIVPGRGSDIWFWAAAVAADTDQFCLSPYTHSRMYFPIPQNDRTKPLDRPGRQILEERFQRTIDYFGIREKLIRELPDRA